MIRAAPPVRERWSDEGGVSTGPRWRKVPKAGSRGKQRAKHQRGLEHSEALRRAYGLMLARMGHQHWWPGETPFEVCVGAILTQNTAWSNVERAIANLKRLGPLEPRRLYALPEAQLARALRPSGYFNVKARRLRAFLRCLVEQFEGDLGRMLRGPVGEVRERLLSICGVGPETADSMLLYAGGHHRFVIDAYTKRVFVRHGWCGEASSYGELQELCEGSLNHRPARKRLDYWQDYHAQLVMVGKHYCRPRNPRCDECPLRTLLPGGLRGDHDRSFTSAR